MLTVSDKVFSISDEAYEMVLCTISRNGWDPWLDNFTELYDGSIHARICNVPRNDDEPRPTGYSVLFKEQEGAIHVTILSSTGIEADVRLQVPSAKE